MGDRYSAGRRVTMKPPDVSAAFEAHVAPVRDALSGLLDASDEVRDAAGSLPAADSPAMAEVAQESNFRGGEPWGADPVGAAHSQAQLLVFAAEDCARSLVRLLAPGPTPVYSHTVVARATLELAGRAWWLLEPAISVRLRIARGMNERIYALSQQIRLPLPAEEREGARKRRTALLDEGSKLKFKKGRVDRKTPPHLDERRPGQTELIKSMLRMENDESLGAFVYGFYSAVAHGTLFGLTSSVSSEHPNMPKTPGVTWGAIVTSSGDVVSVLSAVIIGWVEAIRRRNSLFGWESVSWNGAAAGALDVARRSLPREGPSEPMKRSRQT
jgi:hypothetical protein